MIHLKIVSPLPDMLGLSADSRTLKKELEYEKGMTTGTVMERLAEKSPAFGKLWSSRECAVLQQFLFAVNGAAVEAKDKWNMRLTDGTELMMFMPYTGG